MKIKVSDKREFDISIVNPEVNPELAKLLNPVVKEFKNKNKLCQSNRGFCFIHSKDFLKWVDTEYPVLYRKLTGRGIKAIEGLFQLDDPEKLPLEDADLYDFEFEKFLDENEEEYFQAQGEPRDMSKLIWEWSQKNIERLDDFYYMNHGWIEVGDLIIDFTWLQFRHAINNKVPLSERYEYL
jgi:hypothetical protein